MKQLEWDLIESRECRKSDREMTNNCPILTTMLKEANRLSRIVHLPEDEEELVVATPILMLIEADRHWDRTSGPINPIMVNRLSHHQTTSKTQFSIHNSERTKIKNEVAIQNLTYTYLVSDLKILDEYI